MRSGETGRSSRVRVKRVVAPALMRGTTPLSVLWRSQEASISSIGHDVRWR